MSFCVHVEPTNPGQFFACCGLLELADRLWPGATGWFQGGTFRVECEGGMREALASLLMDAPEEVTETSGVAVRPLIAPLRFTLDGGATTALTLDAWMTFAVIKGAVTAVGNSPWNFWSGQQTSMNIWSALRAALARQLPTIADADLPRLLSLRLPLSGRFGFDPGAAWNALDVGFSPNEQCMEVASSAAVELLAAVGVQRFRPTMNPDRQSFIYATWSDPLPVGAAEAAAAGLVRGGNTDSYRGRAVSRGSYGALGHSTVI